MQLVGDQSPSQRGAAAFGALLLLAATVGTAARPAGSADRELAAAVTRDGFALLEGAANDRHVVEVDRDGGGARRRAIAVLAPDARMVGTVQGVAMGWQNADKFEFARVVGDGELGEVRRYGKRVVGLCDGVATNEQRWGIAWSERDGGLMMLHGPTARQSLEAVDEPIEVATTAPVSWCAVRSAGPRIAFVWRDQRKRGFIQYCSAKSCEGTIVRLPVSPQHSIEGIACNARACVLVLRDDRGAAVLGWMTDKGKAVWSKPLGDVTPESRFSLAAVGANGFAIGYVSREGATVTRVIESGSMVRAWADPYAHSAPAIAWATGRLFVAHRHESGVVAPEVVPLPE